MVHPKVLSNLCLSSEQEYPELDLVFMFSNPQKNSVLILVQSPPDSVLTFGICNPHEQGAPQIHLLRFLWLHGRPAERLVAAETGRLNRVGGRLD